MSLNHFDAIIIGAGISGISAAYHLQKYNASKTYAILERRQALGGTWDLFNYPGIRSDSDMHTFGFSFKPWTNKSTIAEKHKIIDYLHETSREFDIDKHVQYGVHINKASWSGGDSRWTLESTTGEQFTCQYIFMCAGYYNYDKAHEPAFEGLENFKGDVLHPQFWPETVDYKNKNVVIIGSGATAVTLLPSMAEQAKKVTMLQRSPSYISAAPAIDPIANFLSTWLGRWAARWWFILSTIVIFSYCKHFPERAKRKIQADIKAQLGDKFVAKHFSPSYNPWDQRVCLCPDGDFFQAINAGKAAIETDTINGFKPNGIILNSGKELDADIIVTATGLKVQFFGGIDFIIDGKPLIMNQHYAYKGMMLSGVPNTFLAVGYTNAAWTLKVDLTHRYANRLISHVDAKGFTQACATVTTALEDTPLLDMSSGYVQRSLSLLPKQAATKPWRLNQHYIMDMLALKFSAVDCDEMHLS